MRLIILKHQLGKVYGWLPQDTDQIEARDINMLLTFAEIDSREQRAEMEKAKSKSRRR